MFAKLAAPRFMVEIRLLLSPESAELLTDEEIRRAFVAVFTMLISIIPARHGRRHLRGKKFGIA
jgi:hypothetical protein